MKYAAWGGCVLLVSVALGTGCALTDYSLITDNDQLRTEKSNVVDTNGKAHISTLQAGAIWPDGTEELIAFVDQAADGDRTITNYVNFSSGSHPTFHTDLYCNPDWNGCSVYTAPDPEFGDVGSAIFDGTFFPRCSGARSVSILLATSRYYGECGRAGRLSLEDRLAVLASGRIAEVYGATGLVFDGNQGNLEITLDNNEGAVRTYRPIGNLKVIYNGGVILDATNPLMRANGLRYAEFLQRYGTESTTVTVRYNGIARSFLIAGNTRLTGPERVRELMNRRF